MHRHFLVTGGAGFVGSHLCEALLEQGHRVTVIDDLSTGSLKNIESLLDHENFQFVRSSITQEIVLDRLASQSDIIVHLAAAVGVQLIVDRPVHTIETNVMGTEAVLKAALRYRNKVLLASTSEVYGKGSKVPFSEEDDVLLGPTSKCRWAYSASKMVDEFLGLAYAKEYGLEVVVFRLFNTVGPRQSARYGMVIPRFIRQAIRQESLTIHGSGEQRRCFCHVRDVVRGIISLSEDDRAIGEVFNIGGEEEISMLELAQKIRSLCKSRSELKKLTYEEAYGPGFEDMQRRLPCTQKIHSLVGWKPKIKLEEILKGVRDHEMAAMVESRSRERVGRGGDSRTKRREGASGTRSPNQILSGSDRTP